MALPTALRSDVVGPPRFAARRPPGRTLDPFLSSELIRDRGRKLGERRQAHKNQGDNRWKRTEKRQIAQMNSPTIVMYGGQGVDPNFS